MMPKPILTHWKDVLILTLLLIIGLFCIPFPMTEDKSPHFRNIAHAELSPSEEASLTGRLKEIQTDIEYNQSDIHKIELRVESNETNFRQTSIRYMDTTKQSREAGKDTSPNQAREYEEPELTNCGHDLVEGGPLVHSPDHSNVSTQRRPYRWIGRAV